MVNNALLNWKIDRLRGVAAQAPETAHAHEPDYACAVGSSTHPENKHRVVLFAGDTARAASRVHEAYAGIGLDVKYCIAEDAKTLRAKLAAGIDVIVAPLVFGDEKTSIENVSFLADAAGQVYGKRPAVVLFDFHAHGEPERYHADYVARHRSSLTAAVKQWEAARNPSVKGSISSPAEYRAPTVSRSHNVY
ncbi:hypothetical protein HY642_00995 [Candidatus Woesearchaeota archaeon]|nr:hypothetical protein [Candidatus Woesearchaeota archaeon]